MNRHLFIPAMAPVMLLIWMVVLSADHLHAWKYAENIEPPTQSDYASAGCIYISALLTPILIGGMAAIAAYQKKCRPCWPVLETVIVSAVYLMFIVGLLFSQYLMGIESLAVIGIVGASCLMGGVVVVTLFNLGACLQRRSWGKSLYSILIFLGGMLYLFWLYTFIIYVDT